MPGASGPKPVLPDPAAPSSEVLEQFNGLNARIQQLATEKQGLEAKLREALAAQPAPVDPRELQDAADRIAALQSTNKTLLSRLDAQERERRNLVDKVVAEEAAKALADARRQLDDQKRAASMLAKERADVEARLAKLNDDTVRPLKLENQTLKQQVTDLRSDTEKGKQVAELSGKLTRLTADLSDLRTRNDKLTAEKSALEKQVEEMKARQSEEGIVRIAKLQSDLAVARAEADRNLLKADGLVQELDKEKKARSGLESDNKALSDRLAALTARTAADAEALQTLQAALAAEKAERAGAEASLKAAEERLKAASAVVKPGDSAPPEALTQVAAAKAEVARLQETLKLSTAREVEMQSALAHESALRKRLEKEKVSLEKRLAEATAAGRSRSKADPEATRSLEAKVRALEKERQDLKEKLSALSQQARTRMIGLKGITPVTPREKAAEFRLSRP
jgi:chemotaxis protein MotB